MTPSSSLLHLYEPPGAPSLSARQLDERQRKAERLIASLLDEGEKPARTHRSGEFVRWDAPIQALPGTRSYETRPPPSLSPQRLLQPLPPPPAATAADEAVPSFPHWRPPSSSSHSLPAEATAPGGTQQGILQRRPTTRTAGGWADSAVSAAVAVEGGKGTTTVERKRVRVESPRTTALLSAANAARVKEGEGEGRAEGGRRKARRVAVLVPNTPEQAQRERVEEGEQEEEEEGGRERPELVEGAVRRCIPYPYQHTHWNPSLNLNPPRQHPARVLYSFVDPSFVPLSSSRPTSSSNLAPASFSAAFPFPLPQSSSLVRTASSGSSQAFSHLSASSPRTLSYLAAGRRGSWLIPLSSHPFASLSISSSTPPPPVVSEGRWFASPPPPTLPSRPPLLRNGVRPSPQEQKEGKKIDWTDARLSCLWTFLDTLHENTALGSLRATCVSPPSREGGGGEYLKVTTDAHLALPLRSVLAQVNVKAIRAPQRAERGEKAGEEADREDEEDEEDGQKFLKGVGLVWVDEEGGAVLVA
ncbi:hypothetical protein JCM8547_001219 [Rhodosporidiobolus lusitaniae]